jgi:hypothetical protein
MLRWLVTDGEATVAVHWRDDGRTAVGGYVRHRVAVEKVAEAVLGPEREGPKLTQRNKLRYTGMRLGKDVAVAVEALVDAGWSVGVVRTTGRVMR